MLTREQALTEREFHANSLDPKHTCKVVIGPRGGRKVTMEIWRRNGRTKLWKTRPNDFKIPVKYGMGYGMGSYNYITQDNLAYWHVRSECPVLQQRGGN
jgi:hypothetical protein